MGGFFFDLMVMPRFLSPVDHFGGADDSGNSPELQRPETLSIKNLWKGAHVEISDMSRCTKSGNSFPENEQG
jgi:hypothetical protein